MLGTKRQWSLLAKKECSDSKIQWTVIACHPYFYGLTASSHWKAPGFTFVLEMSSFHALTGTDSAPVFIIWKRWTISRITHCWGFSSLGFLLKCLHWTCYTKVIKNEFVCIFLHVHAFRAFSCVLFSIYITQGMGGWWWWCLALLKGVSGPVV